MNYWLPWLSYNGGGDLLEERRLRCMDAGVQASIVMRPISRDARSRASSPQGEASLQGATNEVSTECT